MKETQMDTEVFRRGLTRAVRHPQAEINTVILNINNFSHRVHRETQRFVFCFNSLLGTVFKTKRSAQKISFDASRFDFEHKFARIGKLVEAKNKLTRANLCPSVSENREFSVPSVFSGAKP
jgi:hypothetical protein